MTKLIIRVAKLVVAEISEFWHPMFLRWDDRMLHFDTGNRGAAVHRFWYCLFVSLTGHLMCCFFVFSAFSLFERSHSIGRSSWNHWDLGTKQLAKELQSRYFPEPHIPNVRLEPVSAETRKMRAVGVMKSLKHLVNYVNAQTGTQYRNSNGHM